MSAGTPACGHEMSELQWDKLRRKTDTHAAKHKTPVEAADTRRIAYVAECEVHDVAKHDPKRCPRLEHHDKGSTDERRRTLRRIHWDRRTLWTKAEAEKEASDEEVRPGVREALPDAGDEREDAGDEDRASAADQAVQLESTVRGGQSGVTEQGHY